MGPSDDDPGGSSETQDSDTQGLDSWWGDAEAGKAFIGLFDLLGFKRFLEEQPLPQAVAEMGRLQNLASVGLSRAGTDARGDEIYHLYEDLNVVQYADNILFYTFERTESRLHDVIVASSKLVGTSISLGLPARGVVTEGELYVSPDKGTVLGEGLVRAHILEQQQSWAGGFVDSAVYESEDRDGWKTSWLEAGLLIRYGVPFKESLIRKIWNRVSSGNERDCLGWPVLYQAERADLVGNLRGPKEGHTNAEEKVENTVAFIDEVREEYPDPYPSEQLLPGAEEVHPHHRDRFRR